MWSRVKEIKVRKHLVFVGLIKTFRGWANVVKAEVQQRQLEHYEAEQKALLRIEQFARETYERHVKLKIWSALKANVADEKA